MVYVAFVIDVLSMHFDDCSTYPPGFRIPAHVIAYLERLDHDSVLIHTLVPHPGHITRAAQPFAPAEHSDWHPVTVEFMIFVISTLTSTKVRKIMNELDCCDPLYHLETEFIFAAQP